MDIKEQLTGFRLTWLAENVVQPTGKIGMNINTFYSFVYRRSEDMPEWLRNELKRLTNREII